MSAAETAIAFGPPVEVATGTTSDRALAVDLDGDGLRDLVLLPQVAILRNAGAGAPPGTFRFEAPIQLGVYAYNARIADLNGDARPELILGASNAVVVVENRATPGALVAGSFGPPVSLTINSNASPTTIYRTDLQVGDLDADGAPDVVAAASIRVAWRNARQGSPIDAGSFARSWENVRAPSSSYAFVGMGDVDGDGRNDVWFENLGIFLSGSTNGQLVLVNRLVSGFSAGAVDVDLDGLPDLFNYRTGQVPPHPQPQLIINRNISTAGDPRFSAKVTNNVPNEEFRELADLDGDGRGDFLFLVSTNLFGAYRNPFLPGWVGPRELEPAPGVALPKPTRAGMGSAFSTGLEFADLDGDGLPEALLMNGAGDRIMILANRTQVEPEVRLHIPARVQRQSPHSIVAVHAYGFHIPGTVVRCELLEGTNLVASASSIPATWQVEVGEPGIRAFHVELTTASGSRFSSMPLGVVVDSLGPGLTNAPPKVSIQAPTVGSIYYSPASFVVEVNANDTDGLVDLVELFGVYSSPGKTNRLAQWTEPPFRFTIDAADSGLKGIVARVTDNSGGQTWSSQRSTSILTRPDASFTAIPTNAAPNPLTGYIEEKVMVVNQSSFPVAGFRVHILDLPSGVTVANAHGNDGGTPYVDYRLEVAPGERVTWIIEYRVPVGTFLAQPRFRAELLNPEPAQQVLGETVTIGVARRDSEGRFLLEFQTSGAGHYAVLYSSDLREWTTSLPLLIGDDQPAKWLDQGPPRTSRPPAAESRRFYRVLHLPSGPQGSP